MAIDKTQLLADLRFMITDDPVTVLHDTVEFDALIQAKREVKVYNETGYEIELEYGFVAPITDFNSKPVTGQDIKIDGEDFNIESVDIDHTQIAYRVLARTDYS